MKCFWEWKMFLFLIYINRINWPFSYLNIKTNFRGAKRSQSRTSIIAQRNWVFDTNSVYVKPISLQPDDVNLWYFKLTLFDLIAFIVWNIKGLRHWVATILKLENQSLWQKLNSFVQWKLLKQLHSSHTQLLATVLSLQSYFF